MRQYLFYLLIISTFVSCSPNDNNLVPETFRTSYGKIDDRALPFKFGDLVRISDSKINAVVLDIKKEQGVYWFGLCFLQNKLLFARRIPNGYNRSCLDLLDFTYVKENGLNVLTKIESVPIDFNKIGIGANGSAINKQDIVRSYEHGVAERQRNETPCEVKASTLEPINGYYRDLREVSR